jgi:hypothetical protein
MNQYSEVYHTWKVTPEESGIPQMSKCPKLMGAYFGNIALEGTTLDK